MTWPPFLFLALLGISSPPQKVDLEKWNTVDRMCGKLEHVEKIRARGGTEAVKEKSEPIKKADIRLYQREKGSACCDAALPVAKTTSSKRGEFSFSAVIPDSYWLVVRVGGQDFALALSYAPNGKNKLEASCTELLYEVGNGELQLKRIVTVD